MSLFLSSSSRLPLRYRRIANVDLNFPDYFSPEIKDFISRLLKKVSERERERKRERERVIEKEAEIMYDWYKYLYSVERKHSYWEKMKLSGKTKFFALKCVHQYSHTVDSPSSFSSFSSFLRSPQSACPSRTSTPTRGSCSTAAHPPPRPVPAAPPPPRRRLRRLPPIKPIEQSKLDSTSPTAAERYLERRNEGAGTNKHTRTTPHTTRPN